MANVQDQIAKAKAAGYSDDEIASKLSSMPDYADKFKTATAAGYKPAEIISHLSGPTAKAPAEPAQQAEPSFGQKLQQLNRDVGGGILRGAGSIGSTLIAPYDIAKDLAAGKGLSLESNRERRHAIDMALSGAGADIESTPYQLGKVGTEIAGTLGAGPLMAAGVRALPLAAKAAPYAERLASAIQSGGMKIGEGGAPIANALTRSAGGAITGGASTGLINPEDAGTGAAIGAALPIGVQVGGKVGKEIGARLPQQKLLPDVGDAARKAGELGYVIPPTQVNPTLKNRLLEGMAGKLTTAQNASAKNAPITNSLAAKAIGLAPDTQLSPEVLNNVRKEAGQAYEAVAKLPVKPATSGSSVGNIKGTAEINPKDMVFDLRKARNESTAWYNSYQRTADPDALAKAKSFQAEAEKLQTGLEDYAKSVGREDLVPAMIEARTKIAKTYSIEKALNPTTGTVDARKLGAMLEKGKPLSGELKQAAEFANRFPKAAQIVEKMGSLPQLSPLDWAAGGASSMATGNPLAMAAILARPAARAAALSGPVQRGLTKESQNRLAQLVADPELQQLLARTVPASSAR